MPSRRGGPQRGRGGNGPPGAYGGVGPPGPYGGGGPPGAYGGGGPPGPYDGYGPQGAYGDGVGGPDWQIQKNRRLKSSKPRLNDGDHNNENSNPRNLKPANYHHRSTSQHTRQQSQSSENEKIDERQNVPTTHVPNNNRNGPRKLGFHSLKDLSMKEPIDILQAISNSHCGFEDLITSSPIKPDFMVLIMKIICKACSTEFSELKKRIIILACNEVFLDELVKFITSLPLEFSEQNKARIKPFFENMVVFCQIVIELMPNVAIEKLRKVLIVTEMNVNACISYLNIVIDQTFIEKIKLIIDDLNILAKQKEERESTVKNESENYVPLPTENFREIIVYPQPNDIHLKRPFLQKNIEKGSFRGVEQYLDTQFRLLREDFISPLRNGINDYIGRESEQTDKTKRFKQKFDSVRVYNKVRFLKPKTTLNKVCYEVCFDVDNKIKNVYWPRSKRFMFGSLLLFSNNHFQNFFLGVVANRELKELQSKRVSVDLVHTEDTNISVKELMKQDFEMVESEVYFEPYFNVLNALKNLNTRNFPFEKYIINAKCESSPPKYIANNMDVYKIIVTNTSNRMPQSYTFHLLGYDWPTPGQLYLDESQYTAFKAALTNEFIVIQGPPGTGKTYLGLRIAEALLANKTIWNYPQSPILVVCYTNHALDQFLEGILPLTSNIIRVGGQSKNQNLAPFNLRDRRISVMHSNMQSPLLRDLRKKLTSMFYNIKTIQGKIEILDKNNGVISLKTLQYILPNEFLIGNFNNLDEYLIEWLLEGIAGMRSEQNMKLANCGKVENVVFSKDDDTFVVNEEDFENAERMKSVFIDVMHFEEIGSKPGEVEVHYACTKNNIHTKQAEFSTILEELPNQDMTRQEMHNMMKNIRKTMDDLLTIQNYLEKSLKISIENIEKDVIKKLNKRKDVWGLTPGDRWILYHSWIEKLKNEFMLEMAKCEEKHRKDTKQFEEAKQMEDLNIIKGADVVGITTSTAAKLQAVLGQLAPKIVIAEEAAEVLEAHIIASLTNRCEHLILIGDHKQLRPKPAEYKLAKDYHLDVSLFERMINNGMSSNILTTQHRMRPEVSKLLVPTIYTTLKDHSSVLNRENIRGMEKNLFFLNHNSFEQEVSDMQSKKNVFESKFLIALARHLILQGYKAEEITILATYKGQMFEIKNEWEKHNLAPGLHITVVDNFQGEENKIILLSLVRSNKDARIGFLNIENRVCVALSRAKDGMYIVGNMDNLVASSTIWPKIKQSLIDQEAYGPALVLRCAIHPQQLTQITCAKDFEQVIEGGCNQLCLQPLPCGHICKSLCHVTNSDHALNKCNAPCTKLCPEGHPCKKRCYETCDGCQEPMLRNLLCNHEVTIPCSINVQSYICKREIRVKFKSCGHTGIIPCANKSDAHCPELCPFRLDCGHACERTCHVRDNEDPDHLKYFCTKPCSRKSIGCSQNHICKRACFEDCEVCDIQVVKTLDCGHKKQSICNKKVICEAMCNRTLPCDHKCKKKCKEPCEPCMVMVKKFITECKHEMKMYCHQLPTSANCDGNCNKILTCGHKCRQRCKDQCSPAFCVEPVEVKLNLPCGHQSAAIPCNKRDTALSAGLSTAELLQYCSEPCETFLECNHMCSGTCGQCMQGRIHAVCDQPCGNVLICNHSCPVPCRQVCPPCNKPCPFSCIHSKCPKQCGELCTPCKEPCANICPHYKCKKRCGEICNRPPCNHACKELLRCGHPCVGYCGEPCPPCKPCNPEEYEEFFYTGDETEDDARFVLLEDCQHTFEANGLEHWLNVQPDNDEIVLKVCPKCKTVITKVQRFQRIIKTILKDIRSVKTKAFGKVDDIRRQRSELLDKLGKSTFSMSGFAGYSAELDELSKLRTSLSKDLQIVKNQRRNEYDMQKTLLYNFMTDYILDLEKRLSKDWDKLNDPSKMNLFNVINFLISMLRKRDKKICKQEVDGFLLELNRFHRWVDLFTIENSGPFRMNQTPMVKIKYDNIKTELSSLQVYSDSLDRHVEILLQELVKIAETTIITNEERKMLHEAMSKNFFGGVASTGHWFKCPNGHTYCITECGGAMQEAKCPERGCNAMIGGRYHTYRADQLLASEMDGARHAAWSAGNDLRNFQL